MSGIVDVSQKPETNGMRSVKDRASLREKSKCARIVTRIAGAAPVGTQSWNN